MQEGRKKKLRRQKICWPPASKQITTIFGLARRSKRKVAPFLFLSSFNVQKLIRPRVRRTRQAPPTPNPPTPSQIAGPGPLKNSYELKCLSPPCYAPLCVSSWVTEVNWHSYQIPSSSSPTKAPRTLTQTTSKALRYIDYSLRHHLDCIFWVLSLPLLQSSSCLTSEIRTFFSLPLPPPLLHSFCPRKWEEISLSLSLFPSPPSLTLFPGRGRRGRKEVLFIDKEGQIISASPKMSEKRRKLFTPGERMMTGAISAS